uniref:Putative WRKY transcription factor 16 n=1 Tax=Noccaea caerulescens TaxID=107243 RepID=A0A1J3IFP3_NOCCA
MTDCKNPEQFVCISCVEEVRYSFVSHLSDALRRNGISVFIDTDDLLSKEAQEKVGRARVSVMVFPGNRKVFLEKLVEVLKCQKDDDQVVLPVLYGDSPSLRGEWLSALELSGLSPVYQSSKECSDSQLVDEIVRNVNEKLLFVGRIGIYSKLLEIENMINKQPLGIRCVGIWGMTGIGKTTLAKAVFDQVSGGFDVCCFIQDYDKATRENRVHRILVEQVMKDQPGNSGTSTRLRLRRDKLNNKRVLVVLDDVRNPLVAESFLEEYGWFGPESLIVITSSDKQVFRLCRINQIYEVRALNEKDALQLFMLCASINDTGEQNLQELVMKVIKYANGNPLALSIYGEELKGKKTLVEMETAFLELKKRPPLKFVDAIKSSYDTLNDSENNIFLDIACFFQGENVDYVMQLLEGCGFFPRVGIDVLVEKCLVTISENQVRMHNLIQDVVREVIVKGETVQIETRSRLWEPRTIRYFLEDNGHTENGEPKTTVKCVQGTEEIEGIFLDTSNLNFDVNPAAFENMLNLRLLKIYCSNPEIHPVISFPKGFLQSLPNELRLLHWENYPLQSFPRNFDARHLVEINMPHSQLKKLWGGTKNLEMLKTIKLCHSRQLVDIDDLIKAPNLERIDLHGCTKLQTFPPTGQLLHLRVVNLSGCTEIQNFPEVPPNIETLHLQGTGIRKLSLSIVKTNGGELVNFLAELSDLSDALKLERLTSLVKSSSSSPDVDKLICLELKGCYRLESLPNMFNLEFLKVLDLSGCSKLETIQGFPRNLKELYLGGTAVKEVPQLPQSLELLNAHGCVSLKSISVDSKQLPVHIKA